MKPLIGITANLIKDDEIGVSADIGGPGQYWQALADDYIEAVSSAGGIPVILPVLKDVSEADSFIDCLDGIIFSGGCDLSPLSYGERAIPEVGEISQERDWQELSMMRAALDQPGLPILGICRGCQLLNVALGGSLVPDIDPAVSGVHFFDKQRMSVPTHYIDIKSDSMLQSIIHGENRVNSYHHQCIGRPGKLAEIVASDENGVPECIEVPSGEKFVLGVQWHPEGLARDYESHANLFRAFVSAAAKYKEGGNV